MLSDEQKNLFIKIMYRFCAEKNVKRELEVSGRKRETHNFLSTRSREPWATDALPQASLRFYLSRFQEVLGRICDHRSFRFEFD